MIHSTQQWKKHEILGTAALETFCVVAGPEMIPFNKKKTNKAW